MQRQVRIGIQIDYTVYTSKEKKEENKLFSSLKNLPKQNHSPQTHIYYMEFNRIFVIEYSLFGIIKPFTGRNEKICRILEIEDLSKNVRKTQD